jgi:subtilase family serine protease
LRVPRSRPWWTLRTLSVSAVAVLALAGTVGGATAGATPATGPATRPGTRLPSRVLLAGTAVPIATGTQVLGARSATSTMSVEVVISPAHQAEINRRLAQEYDPTGPRFHHWLPKGAFDRLFRPSSATVAAVDSYLRGAGLTLEQVASPFLVRASGPTADVERAFGTGIENYRNATAGSFYANTSAVSLPRRLVSSVIGVAGLSSLVREHPMLVPPGATGRAQDLMLPASHRPHYGAGPQGSGLTPTQIDSIYGARRLYRAAGGRGRGRGVVIGVFELSAYARSDITTWTRRFYGKSFHAPLVNVLVDGGSIHPVCPTGDTCDPPGDYSGDDEVTADIEQDLAVAKDVAQIDVYDAPNDLTGETTIDEYTQMAGDDAAPTISSSWGLCEQDLGASVARAESIAFEQMAIQGQTVTAAAGDNGPFDCIEDGTSNAHKVGVDDPASQPFVTGVGGTSFDSYDPQKERTPGYPSGKEVVWNPLDGCNSSPLGLQACDSNGAGGGGVSRFWSRPGYQAGPHIVKTYSQRGPYCRFARVRKMCREVPDVSADADEFTPYADYCIGPAQPSNSACAEYLPYFPSGWSPAGGTSLSSPLWAALLADTISYHNGARIGEANVELYRLYRHDPGKYFHDILGVHKTDNSNGKYPVTTGYDLATGMGSPIIWAIAEASYR